MGSKVEIDWLGTSNQQDKIIVGRIEFLGGQNPGFCANAVAQCLSGVGSMRGLDGYFWPNSLRNEILNQLKRQ